MAPGGLDANQTEVINGLKEYKSYLKDPDALTIRNDPLILRETDNEGNVTSYIYADVNGTNSLGGIASEKVMFVNGVYIGNFYDDYDDYIGLETQEDFINAKLVYNFFMAIGEEDYGGEVIRIDKDLVQHEVNPKN